METMRHAKAVKIARRAAELLRDENRVVLDPYSLYEDAQGERVDARDDIASRDNCRVCFIGAIYVAAYETVEGSRDRLQGIITVCGAFNERDDTGEFDIAGGVVPVGMTSVLRDKGPKYCARVLDEIALSLESE
jgi:hypothetical protein